MLRSRYNDLLGGNPEPERYVRNALALLESDLRRMTLLALAEWSSLQIVNTNLFGALTGLRSPAAGTWNYILLSLQEAVNSVENTGTEDEKERLKEASLLKQILKFYYQSLPSEFEQAMLELFELTRSDRDPKPKIKTIFANTAGLRNRAVHDLPTDPDWWQNSARLLKPPLTIIANSKELDEIVKAPKAPAPWFDKVEGELWTFNGIDRKNAAIYVNQGGHSRASVEAGGGVLKELADLLGKSADFQITKFARFLGSIASKEVKGVIIGDYLVGSTVGEGSFGTVHIAQQLSTARPVAVKILREGFDAETRMRFTQEANFLSKFDHNNIVKIYGSGEEHWSKPSKFEIDDEPWYKSVFKKSSPVKTFIAMEWIDGKTLEQNYQSSNRSSWQELTNWFEQAARALNHIHSKFLIHRDLKPSNIMITNEGVVKIMDFGIARNLEKNRMLQTSTGKPLGTPAYMAPEQLRDNYISPEQLRADEALLEVGPKSDLYSLCATFYEMYTHTRLYHHDTDLAITVAHAKQSGQKPEAPQKYTADLPWEVGVILLGGLEPELGDRYDSAEALARDLRHLLADEPIEYRRPHLYRRIQLGYRRNRAIANLTIITCILASIGITSYIYSINRERERTHENYIESQKNLALAYEEQGRQEYLTGNQLRSITLLSEAYKRAELSPGGRFLLARALKLLDSELTELGGPDKPILEPVFSNDLSRIISHSHHPDTILIWDIEQGDCITMQCKVDRSVPLVISPDGTLFASSGYKVINLWDTKTSELRRTLSGHKMDIKSIAFNHDGTRLVSASVDDTSRVWDVDSGESITTLSGHTASVLTANFSRYGKFVVTAGVDRTARIWDSQTGELIYILKGHRGRVFHARFSQDDKMVATLSDDRTAKLWRSLDGKLLSSVELNSRPHGGTFLDGTFYAIASSPENDLRVWDVGAAKPIATFSGHKRWIANARISPDGRRVATPGFDMTARVWDVESQAPFMKLEGHTGSFLVADVAFSTDGSRLISTDGAGTAKIWDLTGGTVLAVSNQSSSKATPTTVPSRVFGMTNGRPLDEFKASPTGEKVLESGKLLSGIVMSADDRWLLSVSLDRSPKLWDADAVRITSTLEGHSGFVNTAAFSPDGNLVATGGDDQILRVWEVPSGRLLAEWSYHSFPIISIGFTHDGNKIMSRDANGTVIVWDASLESRSAEQIHDLVEERVPWRMSEGRLIPEE